MAAGHIRLSASVHASPAFLIPKADPAAKPERVNDYCQLNANTVPDTHPLPGNCAKGKIWGKINMTNSFFQMKVDSKDIHLIAVTTSFGL